MTYLGTFESVHDVPAELIEKMKDPETRGDYVMVVTKRGTARKIMADWRCAWDGFKLIGWEFDGFIMWDGRKNRGLTDELCEVFEPGKYAERMERKAKRNRKRQAAHGLEVGTVFYTSWGYEQTNVEFFEVVKKTEKTVTLRRIAEETEEDGWMQGRKTPRPHCFIDDCHFDADENANGVRRMVRDYGTGENHSLACNIDEVRTAWVWDGEPVSYSSY